MDFYYQSENKDFNLILGDTMETLNHIGQKVDMIFADPPYFLSQGRTRCINGNADIVPLHLHHINHDVIPNHNLLTRFTSKYEHYCSSLFSGNNLCLVL